MTGLDARIRAKLSPVYDPPWAMRQYRAALIAVLDLHAAPQRALPGEIHCGELIDWVQGGCPTVRAIAAALGIEATSG